MDRKIRFIIILTLVFLISACRFSPAANTETPALQETSTATKTNPPDILTLTPTTAFTITPSEIPTETPPVVYQSSKFEVAITRGIEYAQGLSHSDWGSEANEPISLLLDVYEPVNAPGNRPAMILIHGGGFVGGSRLHSPIVQLANFFASRGWVCFSIDYRLEGDHGTVPNFWLEYLTENFQEPNISARLALYPAARDAKAAVRWVYANAAEFKINTSYITVGGGSAGAYLAIMLGTTNAADYRDELTLSEDPTLSTTNLNQPSIVHTILDFWGGAGLVNALKISDGLERFGSTDAPILIMHGDEDQTVDFSEAEYLRDTYQSTGAPYAFYPLIGQPHSAWNAMVDGMTLSELAFEFIISQQNLELLD